VIAGQSEVSMQSIEHFQEKWKPVFRPEMRQNKGLEQIRVSGKDGFALNHGVAGSIPIVTS
jgi:hypothetical protein